MLAQATLQVLATGIEKGGSHGACKRLKSTSLVIR